MTLRRARVSATGVTVRVRFAPSPSGYLHIGGARTALFNWLWARQQGGTFILRVEDTDQERSSIDSVRAVLDALRWLKLDWDEGPEVGGSVGPYFQSDRHQYYRAAIETLISKGKAYRCYCTKEELDAQRQALKDKDPKAQFVYPGTCRHRTDQPDLPHVVRFLSPKDGVTSFDDKVFGTVATPNSSQQDFVLFRADGFPLYNLACVVDDHEMGITLVARGRDHIGNTPQQVLLYNALGYDVPEFAHLPMMLNAQGAKLSKRHADVAVQDYRARGYTADGVLNYLARFGWSYGDQEIFTREDLLAHFSWDRVGKSDGKFDEKKFGDVAFEHLKEERLLSLDDYASGVIPFLAEAGHAAPDPIRLRAGIETVRPRARSFKEAAFALDYYFRDPPEFEAGAVQKFLTPAAVPHLRAFHDLAAEGSWNAGDLEARVKAWTEAHAVKMKDLAQPARVALTGRTASPGLYEVMMVLGKERALGRVLQAIALAEG